MNNETIESYKDKYVSVRTESLELELISDEDLELYIIHSLKNNFKNELDFYVSSIKAVSTDEEEFAIAINDTDFKSIDYDRARKKIQQWRMSLKLGKIKSDIENLFFKPLETKYFIASEDEEHISLLSVSDTHYCLFYMI